MSVRVRFAKSLGAHLGEWYRGPSGDWRVGDEREVGDDVAKSLCSTWPQSFAAVEQVRQHVVAAAPVVVTASISSGAVAIPESRTVVPEKGPPTPNAIVGRKGRMARLFDKDGDNK
jgi:hypothetical protein